MNGKCNVYFQKSVIEIIYDDFGWIKEQQHLEKDISTLSIPITKSWY